MDNQQSEDLLMTEQTQQQFALQRIYIKDVSFETPQGHEIFRQAWKPRVNLEMNTRHTRIDEQNFEVVLTLSVTASQDEKTAFLAEVQQAGIFFMMGVPEAQQRQVLGTVCPGILFPYAREAIDNLVVRGSFPPLMLAPVNFDALYNQALKQAQEKGTQLNESSDAVN
jgi:preprotein translocase subunit SecB